MTCIVFLKDDCLLVFFLKLFIFGCVGSLLLHGFSLVVASRDYSLVVCDDFSFWWLLVAFRAQAVGAKASVVNVCGRSSCGSQALEHRLRSCGSKA